MYINNIILSSYRQYFIFLSPIFIFLSPIFYLIANFYFLIANIYLKYPYRWLWNSDY